MFGYPSLPSYIDRVNNITIMKVTLLINVAEAIIILIGLAHVVASATCSRPPYELIFMTYSSTQQTGSITLKCRDSITAEELDISETEFFLNRSSVANLSLREMDIKVVESRKHWY